ncbi:MAG TPA: hypothetical protein VK537_05140, partial [Galbitalea sp.]|nr:hypothetical protein [Galbitalea sp.]
MTISGWIKKPRTLLLALAALLCVAAPAEAIGPDLFNVEDFTAGIVDEAGHDYTLAGGHPFEASTSFSFPSAFIPGAGDTPLEQVKSVFTELPPGFVGNVAAAQRCPFANVAAGYFFSTCPPGSVVGFVTLLNRGNLSLVSLYSVQPAPGYPAEFAFNYAGKVVVIYP